MENLLIEIVTQADEELTLDYDNFIDSNLRIQDAILVELKKLDHGETI